MALTGRWYGDQRAPYRVLRGPLQGAEKEPYRALTWCSHNAYRALIGCSNGA